MTDDQKVSAILALKSARRAVESGDFMVAEQWAESAVEVIREANYIGRQQRQLFAPADSHTFSDKAAIVISAAVLLLAIASTCLSPWVLP